MQNETKKLMEPIHGVDAGLVMKRDGTDLQPENFESNISTTLLENENEKNKSNTSPRKYIFIDSNINSPPLYIREVENVVSPETPEFEEHTELSPTTLINLKALGKNAPTYELENFKKNALLIFNQEIANNPRVGTHKDVDALTNTFEKFGFEVKDNTYHDLDKKGILNKVKEFTSKDFTEYGCIGIAVLAHGSSDGQLLARDRYYNESQIIEHLRVVSNRTLATKPKFVIIQACRGDIMKPPVPVHHSGNTSMDEDIDPLQIERYYLPEEADMLIIHSTYVGTPSYRNKVTGTWFIETLCKAIDELAPTHDLESILTVVKKRVAIDKYMQEYSQNNCLPMCQMPVTTSTLIRKLYLKKFGDATPMNGSSLPPVVTNVVEEMQATSARRSRIHALLSAYGLDHFTYMRNCLRNFMNTNPDLVLVFLSLALFTK